MKHALTFAMVFLLSGTASLAQPETPDLPSQRNGQIKISKFDEEPILDGNLTEEVWQSAAVLTDFSQLKSGVNVPASLPTKVLLGYSETHLYIAIIASDEPGAPLRTSLKRDEIFDDDNVRIILDTFNSKQEAYVFVFNPLGVVADGILTEGVGEDYSVDIPIQSKGRITEAGYTVEAAIPFKAIRYKGSEKSLWGINVVRYVKRLNNEVNSWYPVSPDKLGQLSQVGELVGLDQLPTKPTYEIHSTLSFSHTQLRQGGPTSLQPGPAPAATDNSRMEGQPAQLRPGFFAIFNFTPSLTLKVTANPDYLAGTEVFQTSTYLQRRRSLFDPDYGIRRTRNVRRFAVEDDYLDGLTSFRTPLDNVSKYSVVRPDYIVELSGKIRDNTFDVFLARDPAPGIFSQQELEHPQLRPRIDAYVDKAAYLNAFRIRRDIGEDSKLGFSATAYNFANIQSYSAGFDGRVRVDKSSYFSFQVTGVTSKRPFFVPESGGEVVQLENGLGYSFSFEKQKKNFGYVLTAEGRSKYYRADLGFTGRVNYNRNAVLLRYRSDTNPSASLVAWRVANLSDIGYDWQGRLRYWRNGTKFDLDLPRETYLSFSYGTGYERLLEEDFGARRSSNQSGAFIGADPERATRFHEYSAYGESTPNKKFFVSAYASYKRGEFDLDYDAGPRFLRASTAALSDPDAPLDPNPGSFFYLESSIAYRPTKAFRVALDYSKSWLKRDDNSRLAFDDNTFAGRFTYSLNKFTFLRTTVDYSTLALRMRGQFLFGLKSTSGKSIYLIYNNDVARAGYGPFFANLAPSFRSNGQTFLLKVSYPVMGNIRRE